VPPLRDRPEDVPLLAQSFVREFAAENEKKVEGVTPDTLEVLMRYNWPGNVRELRTAMEHAVVLCRGGRITPRDLPPAVRRTPEEAAATPVPARMGLNVHEAEKQLIIRALKAAGGNRTLAASKLGMSRRTLHRKLNKLQISEE